MKPGHETRSEGGGGAGRVEAAPDRAGDSAGQEFSAGLHGGRDLQVEMKDECLSAVEGDGGLTRSTNATRSATMRAPLELRTKR